MNVDSSTNSAESESEAILDEPYVQTVSTEEFVEAVEKASKKEED